MLTDKEIKFIEENILLAEDRHGNVCIVNVEGNILGSVRGSVWGNVEGGVWGSVGG